MSNRTPYVTLVLAAVSLSAAVVACGGPSEPAAAPAPAASAAPAPEPVATAPAAPPAAEPPAPEPAKPAAPTPVVRYTGFATPESVLHDEARDRYLVSNINGKPSDVDGNGFISELSPDG